MQEQHLFEYAVIRIMPRVERQEFVNAGIILFCKSRQFLHVVYEVNEQKIKTLCPKCDVEELAAHLQAFALIAAGDKKAGPIAQLDPPSRFRWLTAQRSTILQTSGVHPGLCDDPMQTVEKLFDQLVR
ncbi:MAG TPA: DUF3037 domain-containing protein [Chitinophagaceae bacterium]|nr:DUF3037 domain-containing protein [Chitinophagaceae bacterium]